MGLFRHNVVNSLDGGPCKLGLRRAVAAALAFAPNLEVSNLEILQNLKVCNLETLKL